MTNYLLNGFLPLWAPEQNCGSPVWPDAEVFPGFDPISLLINFIFSLNNGNSIYSHITTMFLWHLSFAIGGMLFFRKACNMSRNASIFGFTLLLFSSLTVLNFRQADDYITVYRYVPLLAYTVYRFFKNPSYPNSALLGLVIGLNICGYQTPNIAMVVVFAFLAAIPMLRTPNTTPHNIKALTLAGIISMLIAMPSVIAGFFWISNDVVARKYFPLGYRGGLGDLIGPLVKYYPDETLIYIGLLPFVMVVAWLLRSAKRYLHDPIGKMSYWPNNFMLVFAAINWVMYIGFPENFTGVDKPFFEMRSFNNMLPFILFCCVFFAARMFETIEEQITEITSKLNSPWRLRDNPLLVVALLTLCITIFTELSRPSILSLTINRYTQDPEPNGAGIANHFIKHFSQFHWSIFAFLSIMCFGAIYSAFKQKRLFLCSILLIVIMDLSLMNIKLLTTTGIYATPSSDNERFPSLSTPLPNLPPLQRNIDPDFANNTKWLKQANVIYHIFSVYTNDAVVWFRTQEFAKFLTSVNFPEPFTKLTGATEPLMYYTNRLIKVDTEEVFPTINKIFTNEPSNSAIVVDKNELPAGLPEITGSLVKGIPPAILYYSPNSIKLRTERNEPAYLVYLDSYTPDWLAFIDGKKTDLLRANYLFKSVYVPAGSHIVEFIYRPTPYIIAFWCRLLGWIFGIAMLLTPWIKPLLSKHGCIKNRS
jgi:hypothetical protein